MPTQPSHCAEQGMSTAVFWRWEMCARKITAEFVTDERSLLAVTTAEAPHLPLLSCGTSIRNLTRF